MQHRVDLLDADPFELADVLQDAGVRRRCSLAILDERHPTREAPEADRVPGRAGRNGTDPVELPVATGVLVDIEGELVGVVLPVPGRALDLRPAREVTPVLELLAGERPTA